MKAPIILVQPVRTSLLTRLQIPKMSFKFATALLTKVKYLLLILFVNPLIKEQSTNPIFNRFNKQSCKHGNCVRHKHNWNGNVAHRPNVKYPVKYTRH